MGTSVVPVKSPAFRAKELVTRHPLVAFFTLTFAVTWAFDIFIPHSNGVNSVYTAGAARSPFDV
jgi:hypothetical protein